MNLPIRLLIADDHPLIREAVKLILSDVSDICIVGEASNGRQVIEQLNSHEADVVLMDISMPECDGIQATYHLTRYFPRIKVVAFTLHDEYYYIADMLKAGARGYVYKTADVRTIVEAIKAVANGQMYEDRQ